MSQKIISSVVSFEKKQLFKVNSINLFKSSYIFLRKEISFSGVTELKKACFESFGDEENYESTRNNQNFDLSVVVSAMRSIVFKNVNFQRKEAKFF